MFFLSLWLSSAIFSLNSPKTQKNHADIVINIYVIGWLIRLIVIQPLSCTRLKNLGAFLHPLFFNERRIDLINQFLV